MEFFYTIDTRPFPINIKEKIGLENSLRYLKKIDNFLEKFFKDVEMAKIVYDAHTNNEHDLENLRFYSL